uniref:Ribosomal eL28/Mak16 domain-containing protein n=1 Tax=Brassica oleracea var. oleracea TaxID=109376 RepID=A0A0D3DGS9_BRAOL
MASRLIQVQSKACEASKFVAKHGTSYYRQLLEKNKHYIQEPATVDKCQELSKQLLYTRLASIPGRCETLRKEVDYAKNLWKNRTDLKVEDAGVAALFGLECFAWYCAVRELDIPLGDHRNDNSSRTVGVGDSEEKQLFLGQTVRFGRGNAKVQFNKETNNLCNLNSYKHSGLANKKTVTIQVADKEQGVVLGTTKSKKQNKPKLSVNKSVLKKELVPQDGQSCCQPVLVLMSCDRKLTRKKRQLLCGVVDNYYRPDLKKAALARLSVISKGLRVAKSGPKRRNRQA